MSHFDCSLRSVCPVVHFDLRFVQFMGIKIHIEEMIGAKERRERAKHINKDLITYHT